MLGSEMGMRIRRRMYGIMVDERTDPRRGTCAFCLCFYSFPLFLLSFS